MKEYILELIVSNGEFLPQMDLSYHGGTGYDPVKELMRAIILRTIEDYNSGGELRMEALDYLCAEEDEDHIFAFSSICKHLSMDPFKTREHIIHATHRISTRRRAA